MRRTPSSGCYWGFVLCLRDTLYLFLAIAIIAYTTANIKYVFFLSQYYNFNHCYFIPRISHNMDNNVYVT